MTKNHIPSALSIKRSTIGSSNRYRLSGKGMEQSAIANNVMSATGIQKGVVETSKGNQSKRGRVDGRESVGGNKLIITRIIKVTVEIGIQRGRRYTKVRDRR
jgi:hypothetical protein